MLIPSLILAAVCFIAVCSGRYPITVGDIADIVTGTADEMTANVFLRIRLPRVIFAVVAGAALSVSGLVYQELFANPLVSPDVLGVSGGAGVGASLAIVAGLGMGAAVSSALAGGLLAAALALGITHIASSRERGAMYRSVTMVLAGIVVKALADSAVMTLKYTADPEKQLPVIDYWLMGSLGSVGTEDLLLVLPLCVLPVVFLYFLRYRISVLAMGDEDALGLGAEVKLLKVLTVVLAAIPAAAVTSVCGVISWIGLIVPHGVRMITGLGGRDSFLPCLLTGSAFLTAADTLSRSLTTAEIPISIITSLAGGVLLCVFLAGRKRG